MTLRLRDDEPSFMTQRMTEADDHHPSQRSRTAKPFKNNNSGDVSSLFKAALVAGLTVLFSPAMALSAQADSGPESAAPTAHLPQSAAIGDAARLAVPTRTTIHLPSVLKAYDVVRYHAIFAAQAEGNWPEANRLMASVHDKLLFGHVLAERYLHPHYRSKYRELAAWLAEYGDHPEARRIHRLALKRKPAHVAAPKMPDGGGKPPPAGVKVTPTEPPAERWGAAIHNFRKKRYGTAAKQFEAIARTPKASPWVVSAGAFWAARSYMLGGRPQQVSEWLHTAAEHPLTFYGLLAREMLGIAGDLDLRDPYLHQADARALIAQPAGARAVALLQIDRPDLAGRELEEVDIGDSAALARAVVALANYGNMPGLSLRIGNKTIGLDKAEHDAAIYPVPAWRPTGGYDVDRALIYAVMRRESSFNVDAHNGSGASGLMQLMPATARAMAGKSLSRKELFKPETNIALGQKYIRHLLTDAAVNGDLIRLAAAYNAGPGNVAKWQRDGGEDDPLLFIESLPSRETRIFIETILTDFWVYRMRLGQKTPSLAALASGRWPMYVAQDGRDRDVADATPNRSSDTTDAGH